MQNTFKTAFWVFVSGAGIGWMMGLSNSPILASVITPVLATVLVALAALSSLQSDAEWTPTIKSLYPISIFVLACAITLPAGIYVRSNRLLVAPETSLIEGDGGAFSTTIAEANCADLLGVSMDSAARAIRDMEFDDDRYQEILLLSLASEEKFRKMVVALCAE